MDVVAAWASARQPRGEGWPHVWLRSSQGESDGNAQGDGTRRLTRPDDSGHTIRWSLVATIRHGGHLGNGGEGAEAIGGLTEGLRSGGESKRHPGGPRRRDLVAILLRGR
ncbi:hypothetical protein E2562_038036 [Oryza meyeriana var. granulata]|uniref:Uncharacterized protein n=1 Tax=Oryza meyeriana var. granulata TaxID=110450 RepID=A0A6G1CM37_9ORYZ|nr:hypothetical protein E2562_038036 [Oryza meyeriana var. granulata]